ncbi:hypothetical protein [Marinactinospora rubrisoli]|uniref:Uncharacterized protein n=1 Tax=Marinactinospora rubrisoli TaxID=2715399 RepID=A0ABW2K8W9_9ACTN
MVEAIRHDGVEPSEVDVRLKGTGSKFFGGLHKRLPREEELTGNPEAARRLREWFGDRQERPLRRPYDAMWRLGLEREPSDVDLDINSTALVRSARAHWKEHHSDRYSGDFMGGHGYLDKQTVMSAFPGLAEWAKDWERDLGRPLSLGVFESSGPFDATLIGRQLSSHFQDSDWIIHRPGADREALQKHNARISRADDLQEYAAATAHLRAASRSTDARETKARTSSPIRRPGFLAASGTTPPGKEVAPKDAHADAESPGHLRSHQSDNTHRPGSSSHS